MGDIHPAAAMALLTAATAGGSVWEWRREEGVGLVPVAASVTSTPKQLDVMGRGAAHVAAPAQVLQAPAPPGVLHLQPQTAPIRAAGVCPCRRAAAP